MWPTIPLVAKVLLEEGETLDYVFEQLNVNLSTYWGKDWKRNCEKFLFGRGDPKFRIVMSIMRWVDSKINNNLDSNAE
ncbi:hypothetical protein C1646_775447 [Rhizophagus diaphanus]|nr:hypothetical protein C1646_775447 [Rhizophagus diaphanus] [Rhizophagus sp. MUCL 43196]